MKTSKLVFIIFIILTCSNKIFAQKLMMESDVKMQRFGKDIFYKDYDNNPLDGHYKIADERGNYSDVYFKNGIKDGKNTEYDHEGHVLKTITYKNGKAEGKYTTYHQNGKIRKTGNFINGEEDGKWEEFDDMGKIKNIEHYKNGKKTGEWWSKIYYGQSQSYSIKIVNYKDDDYFGHSEEKSEDSILIWEKEYKNGKTYTHKEYYPNGKLYLVQNLKDGKLDGEKIIYNQNGILKSKFIFKEDQLRKHTNYYANGFKKEIHNYKSGKKNGVYEFYNDKGIKVEEGYYENNYKKGIWKTYDNKTGNLRYQTTFIDDVKNGITKEYNNANRISAEGMFKNNEKDGVWKYYNLAGKLTKEISYNLGNETSIKEYK